MSAALHYFVVFAALSSVLTSTAIWSPARLRQKLVALGLVTLLLPAGYLALTDMLSRPKPLSHEWRHGALQEASVLAARLDEDEQIFVWLELPGTEEPRAYVLPWSENLAKQLHGAEQEATERGTQVRMKLPFARHEDTGEQLFYAPPQPALPDKQPQDDTPLVYGPSSS